VLAMPPAWLRASFGEMLERGVGVAVALEHQPQWMHFGVVGRG
jgi:hypothetical protein